MEIKRKIDPLEFILCMGLTLFVILGLPSLFPSFFDVEKNPFWLRFLVLWLALVVGGFIITKICRSLRKQ